MVVDGRIQVREEEVPAELLEFAREKRQVLIGTLADVDDIIADKFLMEEEPTVEELMVLNTLPTTDMFLPLECHPSRND